MSRDGLLPPLFSRIHPRFRTPHVSTVIVGVLVAVLAALAPLKALAELVSIGTLFAFVLVSGGVVVLRRVAPDLHRPFRCPGVPWIPVLAIVFCAYMMASLPGLTWLRFLLWLAAGILIYWFYGVRHTKLLEPPEAEA
jgi:APA family basic amino acid/polyamine antiporter